MEPTPHYRPTLHFTPRSTWMNDPNGLILHKGRFHLFFQNNPEGRTWGNIGWGHAVSPDLLDWTELPPAIPATEEEMAFSGSVVWDRHNTSGLGQGTEGPLVAVYTSAYSADAPSRGGQQAQSLAYSLDDGDTWTRFTGNPVLTRESTDFRDPRVFWHAPTARWIMVAVEAVEQLAVIYSSANLLDWTYESAVGPLGRPDVLWECPDLLEVPVEGSASCRWVLLLSTNPGGFAGGSGMHYVVGDFDGAVFRPDDREMQWFDHGPDMYAAVSFTGTDEPIIIGWMSNWAYANDTPTAPWQSAMTLPRRLTLVAVGGRHVLRHTPILPAVMPEGTHRLEVVLRGAGDIIVETGEGEAASRCLLRRLPDGDLIIDRGQADPHGVHGTILAGPPIPLPEGPVSGLLIEDHGLMDLFLDDGRISATLATFPHIGPVRVRSTGMAHVTSPARPLSPEPRSPSLRGPVGVAGRPA